LAAHTVRRSAREIVVRKLYGASPGRIAALMAREFAPMLLAAAVVGLPLAAWLAQAWLANFAERSPAAFLALPLALLALVAMTALAAARHALIAMNMRPTLALRD
jgi:cell division protein FtsX